MIKNPDFLQNFNSTLYKDEGPLPFLRALKIFTSLWNQGLKFGVLPFKEPLEGIETDIKIAAVLNSCLKSFSQK